MPITIAILADLGIFQGAVTTCGSDGAQSCMAVAEILNASLLTAKPPTMCQFGGYKVVVDGLVSHQRVFLNLGWDPLQWSSRPDTRVLRLSYLIT